MKLLNGLIVVAVLLVVLLIVKDVTDRFKSKNQ